MRLLLFAFFSVWVAFAAPSQRLSNVGVGTHLVNPQLKPGHSLHRRAVDVPFEWNRAWCKGAKLSQALIKNEAQAAAYVTPVRSVWDGNLISEFSTWGYRETSYGKARPQGLEKWPGTTFELQYDAAQALLGKSKSCTVLVAYPQQKPLLIARLQARLTDKRLDISSHNTNIASARTNLSRKSRSSSRQGPGASHAFLGDQCSDRTYTT